MDGLPAIVLPSTRSAYVPGSRIPTPYGAAAEDGPKVYRDAVGNILQDGDTVTVIKDLKLKGGGGTVKVGTKVKNIRLVDGDHDIDCKIDGFGAMGLKTEFVKKV